MKERLITLLAWLGFLCLLFGVLPLGVMAVGYQLEAMQDKPALKTLSCEAIESPDSEYQLLYRSFEAAEKDGASASSGSMEKYNPQICRGRGRAPLPNGSVGQTMALSMPISRKSRPASDLAIALFSMRYPESVGSSLPGSQHFGYLQLCCYC